MERAQEFVAGQAKSYGSDNWKKDFGLQWQVADYPSHFE